jgi:hypothetical protein
MSKKMILLALVVSLAFIIGACASARPINPAAKGKIGDPVGPSGANAVGTYTPAGPAGGIQVPTDATRSTPMGTDMTNTPVAKGKIGDPVGPSGANAVGTYTPSGPAGGIQIPTDPTRSGVIK